MNITKVDALLDQIGSVSLQLNTLLAEAAKLGIDLNIATKENLTTDTAGEVIGWESIIISRTTVLVD